MNTGEVRVPRTQPHEVHNVLPAVAGLDALDLRTAVDHEFLPALVLENVRERQRELVAERLEKRREVGLVVDRLAVVDGPVAVPGLLVEVQDAGDDRLHDDAVPEVVDAGGVDDVDARKVAVVDLLEVEDVGVDAREGRGRGLAARHLPVIAVLREGHEQVVEDVALLDLVLGRVQRDQLVLDHRARDFLRRAGEIVADLAQDLGLLQLLQRLARRQRPAVLELLVPVPVELCVLPELRVREVDGQAL